MKRTLMAFASALFLLPPVLSATCITVIVPGGSDPWLAGMPNGALASACVGGIADTAPAQSPALVSGLLLNPGSVLTFVASGETRPCTNASCSNPATNANGDAATIVSHVPAAQNGISDVTTPMSALMGVFLSSGPPNTNGAPAALNFASSQSRDYATLEPVLKQVFFIGYATNSAGQTRHLIVPAGATRLYLGIMDACKWWDNGGQLTVNISDTAISPPVVTAVTQGHLAFAGVMGRSYRVEYSTELPSVNWTPFTNVVLSCTSASIANIYAPAQQTRFFRVVELP